MPSWLFPSRREAPPPSRLGSGGTMAAVVQSVGVRTERGQIALQTMLPVEAKGVEQKAGCPSTGLDERENTIILFTMIHAGSALAAAEEITGLIAVRAAELAEVLGARLVLPRQPKIPKAVEVMARYAEGAGDSLSNRTVQDALNSVITLLTAPCYRPATDLARAIFERRTGDPESQLEALILGARARWRIELGLGVPLRWLAMLGGIAEKTLRNLASRGQVATVTEPKEGQVCTATEAARWLAGRGVKLRPGWRYVPPKKGQRP